MILKRLQQGGTIKLMDTSFLEKAGTVLGYPVKKIANRINEIIVVMNQFLGGQLSNIGGFGSELYDAIDARIQIYKEKIKVTEKEVEKEVQTGGKIEHMDDPLVPPMTLIYAPKNIEKINEIIKILNDIFGGKLDVLPSTFRDAIDKRIDEIAKNEQKGGLIKKIKMGLLFIPIKSIKNNIKKTNEIVDIINKLLEGQFTNLGGFGDQLQNAIDNRIRNKL